MYASVDQLNFRATSRKDDIIQLCYLLHYLLMEGNFAPYSRNCKDPMVNLLMCRKLKENFSLEQLSAGRCSGLKEFNSVAFSLKFEEKPNYSYLRSLLVDLMESCAPKSSIPQAVQGRDSIT